MMRERKKFSKKIFIILIFFLGTISFAQEIEYPKIPGVPTPTPTTTFPEYIKYLFNFLVLISGIIAFAVLIWAGILWFTSGGDITQTQKAKRKAFGASLGLVILLSSYLIITAINPRLTIFQIKKMAPKSGIYLIDSTNNKKYYFPNTVSSTTFPIEADQIQFISSPSTLMEIYLYEEKNFKGAKERIENPGTGMVASISEVTSTESIYFLWRKPGLYLYDGTSSYYSLKNFPYPKYLNQSTGNLGEWNERVNQIRIVDPSREIHYGAVVFTDKFEGKCGIIYTTATTCDEALVPDLSENLSPGNPTFCGIYRNFGNIDYNEISSLLIFLVDLSNPTTFGEVIFYDKENCPKEANKLVITPTGVLTEGSFISYCYPDPSTCVGSPPETWYEKVESFEVNGDFEIILWTWDPSGNAICQAEWGEMIDKETGCVTKLKGSSVYPENSNLRPRNFLIVAK